MKVDHFSRQHRFLTLLAVACLFAIAGTSLKAADNSATAELLKPVFQLSAENSEDQDDYAVWINRSHPETSFIIGSDKSANKLYVYDLKGQLVDEIAVTKPGNIDVAYGFPLGNSKVDIAVVNQRKNPKQLVACTIDSKTGKLSRIDNNKLSTGENYGGCLYQSHETGKFYFFSTSEDDGITQYELYDEDGQISSKAVRNWPQGKSEGAVANEEKGIVYIAEEEKGVWKVGAEPDQETPGELIIKLNENGLKGDIEGMALLKISDSESYLVISDQGASTFKVYREETGYPFVGNFKVEGAEESDGIEIIHSPLGGQFSQGLFLCHTDKAPRPGLVVPLEQIISLVRSSK